MEIIKINSSHPDKKVIQKAVNVFRGGGLLVYPTDTAYGLGAAALNQEVIRKVYEIKGRDFTKPTHVIVRDWQMIEKLTYPNDLAKKIFEYFMPGPITIILPKKTIVPNILTAGLQTLGIRIPKNNVTSKLSSYSGFPYTTPSANRSGEKTPYSIHEVGKVLDLKRIDLVLDAGQLPKNKPSTILDLTTQIPKILREGPLLKEDIEKVLDVKITS